MTNCESRRKRFEDGARVFFPHTGKWGTIVRWPEGYSDGQFQQDVRYYMDSDGWRWSVSEKELLSEYEAKKLGRRALESLQKDVFFWTSLPAITSE